MPALARLRRVGPWLEPIFTDDGGAPISRTRFSADIWRPAVERAGVPKGVGFHGLRHYYASLLISQGASVKTVQARLGHASATETLNTYAHLWPESEDHTRAAIDRILGTLAGSPRRPDAFLQVTVVVVASQPVRRILMARQSRRTAANAGDLKRQVRGVAQPSSGGIANLGGRMRSAAVAGWTRDASARGHRRGCVRRTLIDPSVDGRPQPIHTTHQVRNRAAHVPRGTQPAVNQSELSACHSPRCASLTRVCA
jgi:hypothetical protein